MRQSRQRFGFSLVELSISLTLVAVVLVTLGISVQTGTRLFEQISSAGALDAKLGRALARTLVELRGTGQDSFVQDLATPVGLPPVWSAQLDFQKALDWDAGAQEIVWDEQQRLELQFGAGEIANGIDDNGNGLIDEQDLVLSVAPGTADERRAVLASGVRRLYLGESANGVDDNGNGLVDEPGFCLQQVGNSLVVRLCLETRGGDGTPVARIAEDTVTLRN